MYNKIEFGKVCHHFNELASTNATALDLIAKENPDAGTMIIAAIQTAGRGQFGRPWHSEPHAALTVSFIIYPNHLSASHLQYLSQAVALAVFRTVAQHTHGLVEVKWPNDIYLNGKKVAGILIENAISGSGQIAHSVIGIGININQIQFPEELAHATSLAIESGEKREVSSVLCDLKANLTYYYALVLAKSFSLLHTEYEKNLFGLGKVLYFKQLSTEVVWPGMIRSIDPFGGLVIEHALEHTCQSFRHGEIQIVPETPRSAS